MDLFIKNADEGFVFAVERQFNLTQFSSDFALFTITFKLFMLWCPFGLRLTTEGFIFTFWLRFVLLPWQWGLLKIGFCF